MTFMSSRAIGLVGYSTRTAAAVRRYNFRGVLCALLLLWVGMMAPAAWADASPTAIVLAISPAPVPPATDVTVPYKTPITLTATVTSGGNPVTSGLVLFCDANAVNCENNSALGLAQLTLGGQATLKLGSGPMGVHKYKAVYRANNLYLSVVSDPVSYTVAGTYPSTTTVASTGPVANYTVTATVAGSGNLVAGPTGNVSFLDVSAGNNLLGVLALSPATLTTTFAEAPKSPFAIETTNAARSVAIASAFLDGDSYLDVVTGDYAQTITVLLGKGDGTFQPKATSPGCPSGVALKILLADFNRDGKTDVALGCSDGTNGSLTIVLGVGDGTFVEPVSYSSGDVAGIALGDFNGDGIFDVAVTNRQQKKVVLFTGNGDGTFNTPTTVLSTTAALHDVVVADFNSDQKDDLLYAVDTAAGGSSLSDLYLATGNGDGTFNTPALVASKVGEFLTTGDTNGDNFPDVISTTITLAPPNVGNSLFVLIGNGDGTFQPPVKYLSDIPSDPHLADVNGDGKPDIIAGGSYGTLVYQGNGDGTFQAYSEPTIGNFALTYAVNAGDYNNDGNADLIGTDASSAHAAVSLSQVQQGASASALQNVAMMPLGSGTHNVDAVYAGDGIYIGSTSTTIPLLALPTPTTVVLSVSPTSATLVGSPLQLTATLSPYTVGPPTTTTDGDVVKFYNGGTSGTLLGQGTLSNGVATLTTSALPVGADAITAVFVGDANYNTSTSSTLSVTVASIVVGSSPNPSAYSQSVMFTASVGSAQTGTVTFMDGATTLGVATISSGAATYSTSSLSVGLHNITGVYSGDGTHAAATSPVLVQEVDKATPLVVVSTPGPSTYGASLTITASVPAGATGTMTVMSGTTQIGTGSVGADGKFMVTTSSLPVGTDPITANYGGDGNYNAASGNMSQAVDRATPTLLPPGVNPSSPMAGAQVTLTEVVPAGVSGPVTFYNGGASLGSAPITGGTATLVVPSLPAGTDTISASTPGDSNNNPATSPGTSVTVTKNSPTLPPPVLNPSSPIAGAQVTITETVPAGVPGPVTFYDNGTSIGTGTITGGIATLTVPSLPLGTDTITASTPADANNNAATSPATTVTIAKNTPDVTVTPSGPGTYGGTETITVTAPPGIGTVTITSGGTTIGPETVGPTGTVTITTTTLPAGTDTITATYGGDSNNNPVTATATVTISQSTPTVTVSTSGPSIYGAPVTITASVPPGTTGTVTITSGGTPIGSGTVSPAGTVVVTTSTLPVGSDTITASYSGDNNNTPATGHVTQTVSKDSPTVVLTSSSNPSTATQPVTLTATLPTTATGTVTFSDGGTVISTGTVTNGVATVTTSTLPVGGNTITATYSGDTNDNPSTSAPLTQTVNKNSPVLPPPGVSSSNVDAITQVTITEVVPTGVSGPVTFYDGGTAIGTGTIVNGVATLTVPALPVGSDSITASTPGDANNNPATSPTTTVTVVKVSPVLPAPVVSPNNPVVGTSVTISETVPTGVTGPVTFYNGGAVIGTGTIVNGVATMTTSTLPLGADSITASTQSNASYNAATSPVTNVTVAKAAGSVALTSSANPATLNQSVTFTAVANAGATGSITFYDGATVIGTGVINAAGIATFTTSTLTSGNHPITAVFAGDNNFSAATSPALNQAVNRTPTAIVVTASSPMQLLNSTVTFIASVSAPIPTPTGMITFYDGTTVIGTAPMSTNGSAVVSFETSGNAAYTTSSLSPGAHQITASYSGDTGFMPSTSAPVANIVADFTNAATGTVTQKMFPGGSTSYTFVLTPVGSTTFLSDTSVTIEGLPEGTTYSFSPAVIKAGSGATTVTLTLTTSKTLKAESGAPEAPGSSHGVPITLAILGLAGMGAIRRHRKQMPRLMMLVLLSIASLLPIAAMTGCAGGYFALDPNTYTLKVTGTEGPIQHTATTTLVVQ